MTFLAMDWGKKEREKNDGKKKQKKENKRKQNRSSKFEFIEEELEKSLHLNFVFQQYFFNQASNEIYRSQEIVRQLLQFLVKEFHVIIIFQQFRMAHKLNAESYSIFLSLGPKKKSWEPFDQMNQVPPSPNLVVSTSFQERHQLFHQNPAYENLLAPQISNEEVQMRMEKSYSPISKENGHTKESPANIYEGESLFVVKTPAQVPLDSIVVEPFSLEKKQGNRKKTKKAGSCNCKNSRCLQLYCDCFKNGRICGEECNCRGCENISENEEKIDQIKNMIIEKDPFAFIEKKRYNGCKCTKNHCSLNYCECFKMGVGCGKYCGCKGCENGLGRKEKKKKSNNRKKRFS